MSAMWKVYTDQERCTVIIRFSRHFWCYNICMTSAELNELAICRPLCKSWPRATLLCNHEPCQVWLASECKATVWVEPRCSAGYSSAGCKKTWVIIAQWLRHFRPNLIWVVLIWWKDHPTWWKESCSIAQWLSWIRSCGNQVAQRRTAGTISSAATGKACAQKIRRIAGAAWMHRLYIQIRLYTDLYIYIYTLMAFACMHT